ncbi:DUF1287 domain-containing protein [Bifidobacterium sp. MA2]|uniref:DUF1287 domain-containing protein n=1 Tax=Bifidobacterium santillanense TaxID=2809028 RepID=A0ABS5UMA1_9BIFI|nr:DUF1287 domain-containing protein [Bifidobacterium santillanense]MBT1171925.1 DUF1287 domain-containing protein [Bifidobacterium santillanense]
MARHEGNGPRRNDAKRAICAALVIVLLAAFVAGGVFSIRQLGGLPWEAMGRAVVSTAKDGGPSESDGTVMPRAEVEKDYPKVVSPVDYNSNGADDYTDIVKGARADAEAAPTYDDGYYQGGYPPDDRGACTDLVWRAFRAAGYDLKAMVDADVAADPASYHAVASKPDPNIDFRRTGVLDVFFAKYGQSLTLDPADHEAWQGGDIIVFRHVKHIGVVSDKRDRNGVAYILHNMGQRQRENDYLTFRTHMTVTGHYRFDASKVPESVLKAWR